MMVTKNPAKRKTLREFENELAGSTENIEAGIYESINIPNRYSSILSGMNMFLSKDIRNPARIIIPPSPIEDDATLH